MPNLPTVENWSVLILCAGHGRELLRDIVRREVERLGFRASVYDHAGYPVDPTLHSHAACVTAVQSHDIILAFLDESEGGAFQVSQAPPEMVRDLRRRSILPPAGSLHPIPTILQVEVMTARSLSKPVLVFVPRTVQARVDQTLEILQSQPNMVTPRAGIDRSRIEELVARRNWTELSACAEDMPVGRMASFRQVAFLELLRREAPNFMSYYDPTDSDGLQAHVTGRVGTAILALIKQHARSVQDRIERKRNPLGTASLHDLVQGGFVVSPPFRQVPVDNAALAARRLVHVTPPDEGVLSESLRSGRSVLLLGAPGLGKTTNCLLAFHEVFRSTYPDVETQAVLYGSWRELTGTSGVGWNSSADLVRLILGVSFDRPPWPSMLPLPNRRWIIILDGMDEATLDAGDMLVALENAHRGATLLTSCRRHDYDRQLQRVSREFNLILELEPWKADNISAFVQALRRAGKNAAAELIERHAGTGQVPAFISFPLWLNMLAFLADRQGEQQHRLQSAEFQNDYGLLRLCAEAVAEDEVSRHGVGADGATLRQLWSLAAWELHQGRGERETILLSDLASRLGVDFDSDLGEAVLSFLYTLGVRVLGFIHQVFQEYWLAEYLVDWLADASKDTRDLATRFSYQRSVITNRLIRMRCTTFENRNNLTARLRDAFSSASVLGEREQFAKNQIIYLLGRIDDSATTKSFLRLIWRGDAEAPFVKYSAAFAAIMQGDGEIEQEYYTLLLSSEEYERMNRGYHLYYYGDEDLKETEMPPEDNGTSPAEATLRQLFLRLQRTQERHRNLRRIELLTIRRFIETGRAIPSDSQDAKGIIRQVIKEAKDWKINRQYPKGVRDEGTRILKLLP